MEREVILDTETTGLDPKDGHRIIEIGCVEVFNRMPTGKVFHHYINPLREIGPDATRIHGITNEMVTKKPIFEKIADEFLEFVGDSRLVIHNADFDMKFLNAELFYLKKADIPETQVFCTLKHARKKYPGAQNSLDALCKRFSVDNSHRDKHGALLDAEILAAVYLELMGGRQNTISLTEEIEEAEKLSDKRTDKQKNKMNIERVDFTYRKFDVSDDELSAHKKFAGSLKNSLWDKIYLGNQG